MRITIEPLPGVLPPRQTVGCAPTSGSSSLAAPGQPTLPVLAPAVTGDRGLSDAGLKGISPVAGQARRVAQAICEVVVGRRPIGQLSVWATYPVLADVLAWSRRRGRVPAQMVVRSVRVQHPHRRAAEVSVRLMVGSGGHGPNRSLALALRLDRSGDRWVCTAVDAGPQGLSLPHAGPSPARMVGAPAA